MRRVLAIVLAAIAAQVVACADPPPPPPPPPPPAPKPVALGVPDAGGGPELRYVYNPVGKRDPFRTPLEDTPKGELANAKLCSEPLCQMDLDSLILVAVVTGDADPVAMVEDPGHIGFIVHRGTRIGKQGGKITQISRDCIEVTEFFQTPDGKSNPNKVNLCVKSDGPRSATLDLLNNRNVE